MPNFDSFGFNGETSNGDGKPTDDITDLDTGKTGQLGGSRGNHNVPALYIHIHSAAGPHPDECMGAAQHQFFHCNGGRWSANAGGGHAHHLTVQIAGVCNVLPAVGNQPGIVKIAGYPGTALGISRHNDIPAHIPFPDL